MKRSLRVLLALVLVLSMCLGIMPVNAFADATNQGLFWYDDSHHLVRDMSGVVVPNSTLGTVGVIYNPPKFPDAFIGTSIQDRIDKGDRIVGWIECTGNGMPSNPNGPFTGNPWRRIGDFNTYNFTYTKVGGNYVGLTPIWRNAGETDWVTITFDAGFEKLYSPVDQEVKIGEKAVNPATNIYNPEQAGFTPTNQWVNKKDLPEGFDYAKDWALVKDAPNYDFSQAVQEGADLILRWEKLWHVQFVEAVADGENKVIDEFDVKDGDNAKAPELKNDGYALSWYYMNGDEKVEFLSGKTAVTKDIVDGSGNLTVYSEWKAVRTVNYYNYYPNYPNGRVHGKPYTVTYTETDDAGVPKTFTLPEYKDTGFTAPLGYIFIGWRLIGEDPSSGSGTGTGTTTPAVEKKAADVALKAAKAGPEAEKADIKEIEKADITAVDKIDVTEKDNIDVSEKEKEEAYKVYQPGDEVELSSQVYVIPEWKHVNTVTYYTNYLSVYGDGRMEDDEKFVTDKFEETVKSFTVKTFEDAFGADQPVPLGYKFVGWVMHFSDQDIEKEPAEGTVIGPGWSSEVGNQDARKSAATDTAVKEAVKETIPEAALKEEKEALPATTAEKETAQEKEQAEALDTPPAEADPAEPVADKVDEEAEIVNPGDTKDMHLHVYLDAVYEPCFKVIYHNMDDDFAADKGKDIPREETEPEEYSTKQYKDADGKFLVKKYSETGLKEIPGYEFDYWTMEWMDPMPSKEPAEPRPDLPVITPEYPIEEAEKEELKEEVKEEARREATVLKAVKAAGDTAEVKESAEAVTAVTAEEKEKIDASEATELKPIDLTDKEAVEDDKDEEKEPEKADPGDKKDLHAEVHLFANWKAKVYTATWVDEDGKTVLHGPVDFTVEEGQPKDTDYNKLSGKDDPTKEEDEDYTYEFSGWKETVDEDGNVTYTAQYTATPKPKVTEEDPVTHTATWVDEDGETELNKETFKDGEDAPKADSFTAPEKEGKEFEKWTEEKVKDENGKETGDVIYTAVYKDLNVPDTGDANRPEIWIMTGLLSMLGFVLLGRKRKEE